MSRFTFFVLILPLSLFAITASPASLGAPVVAKSVPTGEVVAATRKEILDRYVLPDTAAKLDAQLAAAAKRHDFDNLAGEELAVKINAVIRSVTSDGHLSIWYAPPMAASLAASPQRDDADTIRPEFIRQITLSNGGVAKLELLPGNLRYLDYRGFQWGTPDAKVALTTAMAFLRGGDAIIIDLRNNGGGSPEAVAALASYFLPPATKLMRFEMRNDPGQASETGAAPFILTGKPLYVLTSKHTFSAAEEFADHVSTFGFGTLVGETTGGGGFRNTLVAIPGGFVMSISVGRAVHVVTGRDWEGVGIVPKIAVPADQALTTAQAEAMHALAGTLPASERDMAERFATFYRATLTPVEPGHPTEAYLGRYGERTIAIDAKGNLTTQRNGNLPTRLVAIGRDLFVPESSPAQHFQFIADGGAMSALEADDANGDPKRSVRATSPPEASVK